MNMGAWEQISLNMVMKSMKRFKMEKMVTKRTKQLKKM